MGSTDDMAKQPLLLIIDHDGRTAKLLARLLKEDGFRAEVVCDAGRALGRLSRAPKPDVIVTDFRMPHADGVTIAQYARSRLPAIPIFIVTGYPELVVAGSMQPQPFVFTKPLGYSELTSALRAALQPPPPPA